MQQAYNTPVIRSIPSTTSLRPIYLPEHPEAAIDCHLLGADNFHRVFGGNANPYPCGGCGTCGGYTPRGAINYRQLSYLNPLPAKVTGGRKPRKLRRR